ncbi:MAG: hypothetical protein SH850_17790 [Planctomycetaceae bacterium]|nr:hypothetical protein [Planctomycetaceae bacterium]
MTQRIVSRGLSGSLALGLFAAAAWLSLSFAASGPSLSADIALVGDDATDNSAAIQQALDAGLGSLHFPKGRYRLTKTVTVNLDKTGPVALTGDGAATVIMTGPGPAFRFVGTHEGSAAPSRFRESVWRDERAPMIDGLEIVGAHPEAVGIEADGTMQLTISRVVVRRALHGIHLTGRNRNVILSNCHLYETVAPACSTTA